LDNLKIIRVEFILRVYILTLSNNKFPHYEYTRTKKQNI